MKIEVIKIGKCKHPGIPELIQEYFKRLKPLANIDGLIWKDNDAQAKLSKLMDRNTLVIALDERGTNWSSVELAQKVRVWADEPAIKKCVFVIGGPYGLSPQFRKQAQHLWSLSSCTLPSDFAWLLVCEQIYRAFTILKGMSYHHE